MDRTANETLIDIRNNKDQFLLISEASLLEAIESDFYALFDMLGTYFYLTENKNLPYYESLEKIPDYFMVEGSKIDIDETGDSTFYYNPLILCELSLEDLVELFKLQMEYVETPLPLMVGKKQNKNISTLKDGILKQLYEERKRLNPVGENYFGDKYKKQEVTDSDNNSSTIDKALSEMKNLAPNEETLTCRAYFQALRMEKQGLSFDKRITNCFSFDSLANVDDSEKENALKMFQLKKEETVSGTQRGTRSGDENDKLTLNKKAKKPSWDKMIRNIVGSIPYGKRHTHTRLNRLQPLRSDLSGTLSDRKADLVCAIDTSGSMNEEMMSRALSEIYRMKKSLGFTMTLIECDSSIQLVKPIKKLKDLPELACGRGGTAYTPVIEYLNENKKYRNSVLVYFTDGFGEREIPKPMVKKVLWVIVESRMHRYRNDKRNISLDESYGLVVPLTFDKD